MELLKGIRHISFDLWLTLIRSDPAFKPLRNELFARYFGVIRPLEEVAAAFRHFDILFNKINERSGGNVHYSEMLYVILDHLGVPVDKVPAGAMEDYYHAMEKLFFEHPPQLIATETKDILEKLKDSDHTINILSNTGFIQGKTLRPLLRQLAIDHCFDFQLYSDEMGVSKPSARAYENVWSETLKIRSLQKEEILHIGDNPVADIGGARQFGFRSAIIAETNTLRNLFLN